MACNKAEGAYGMGIGGPGVLSWPQKTHDPTSKGLSFLICKIEGLDQIVPKLLPWWESVTYNSLLSDIGPFL